MNAGSEAKRVTVVTVSYNSADVLERMLSSLPPSVATIVVDNGGSDAVADVAHRFGARLVRLETNAGFGRGCNAGAALSSSEFIFFVNPDAIVVESAIEALVAFFDAEPTAAAANPRILDGRGKQRFRGRSLLSQRTASVGKRTPAVATEVPTLLGSAFFCRRTAFEAVGGFDPAIFLYHEDDDLAVRIGQTGGRLFFVPQATVKHQGGHSSGRSHAIARLKGYHMARARAHVMAKHGRQFAVTRTIVRASVEALLPHNLFSARRRAKHIGQLLGAWSAIRDGGAYHAPLVSAEISHMDRR